MCHAYSTNDWWLSAPGMMARALSARFYGNEELTKKLLATCPRQLAKASQYDVRWGIGLTQTEATLGMDWRGTNWMGQTLMKLRAHLLQAQIPSSRTEIDDAKSIIPTDQEVVKSELLVGGNSNQLRDVDLPLVAQLFMPKSNEQQAALFGNSVMGSILPIDQMGAPLAILKATLIANGVTFIGEKRVRPTADQGPQKAKRSSAVATKLAPCVTCIQMRADDCIVCKMCCVCCLCIPRKNFVPTHVYAGSLAEGQMSSEKSNHEVAAGMLADEAEVDAGALQWNVSGLECLPFSSLQAPVLQQSSPPSDALGSQLSDALRPQAVEAEALLVTQYAQCEHGFVLIQGAVDTTLQPQCARPGCVSSAVVSPEAVAHNVEAVVHQAVTPGVAVKDVHTATFVDDEDFYDCPGSQPGNVNACDGYKCGDCGAGFVSTKNLEDHNCAASGNTVIHPPATRISDSPNSHLSYAPVAQPSSRPSDAPSAQPSDEQGGAARCSTLACTYSFRANGFGGLRLRGAGVESWLRRRCANVYVPSGIR